MRSLAALLAAVFVATALAACDGDGAEPGAPREATLVLDFQPNAVHAGIYSALRRGYYEDEGIGLEIREPSASTDAPKLLEAGRTDFAIMDINDVGIALDRGLDVRPFAAVVEKPLAAVIAADRNEVRRPRDLEGGTVGVTGLPSDEAVLDAMLEADGADPEGVERITIGFDAVAALSAGRLDAATAFWNAEGVTLRRLGVPTRELRIDDYGPFRYPELLVVTSGAVYDDELDLNESFLRAVQRGNEVVRDDPASALEDLLAEVPHLDAGEQEAQLDALMRAHAFGGGLAFIGPGALLNWLRFAERYGIVDDVDGVRQGFLAGAGGV